MTKKQEISYISILQILGPILVILGHSVNGINIGNSAWYVFTKEWIYFFHMPLFFMISGYLLSFRGWLRDRKYGEFVKNKFKRLIVPYLFWNAICYFPKLLLQIYVTDQVSLSPLAVLRIFFYPRQNILGHTWFLVALFLLYLLEPIWEKVFSKRAKRRYLTLIMGIILYCLPIKTEFLCFSDLHKDILFFMLGLLLGTIPVGKFINLTKKFEPVCVFTAIFVSFIFLYWYEPLEMFRFIPCFFILLAMLTCTATIKKLSTVASKLANRAFGIYIMHWPIMVMVRILMFQVLHMNTIITIIAMIILGYIVPNAIIVLLQKVPIKKIKQPLHYLLGV